MCPYVDVCVCVICMDIVYTDAQEYLEIMYTYYTYWLLYLYCAPIHPLAHNMKNIFLIKYMKW